MGIDDGQGLLSATGADMGEVGTRGSVDSQPFVLAEVITVISIVVTLMILKYMSLRQASAVQANKAHTQTPVVVMAGLGATSPSGFCGRPQKRGAPILRKSPQQPRQSSPCDFSDSEVEQHLPFSVHSRHLRRRHNLRETMDRKFIFPGTPSTADSDSEAEDCSDGAALPFGAVLGLS